MQSAQSPTHQSDRGTDTQSESNGSEFTPRRPTNHPEFLVKTDGLVHTLTSPQLLFATDDGSPPLAMA